LGGGKRNHWIYTIFLIGKALQVKRHLLDQNSVQSQSFSYIVVDLF
jgi:hypothetical protein